MEAVWAVTGSRGEKNKRTLHELCELVLRLRNARRQDIEKDQIAAALLYLAVGDGRLRFLQHKSNARCPSPLLMRRAAVKAWDSMCVTHIDVVYVFVISVARVRRPSVR